MIYILYRQGHTFMQADSNMEGIFLEKMGGAKIHPACVMSALLGDWGHAPSRD